jgi:acyl transferase domain-containing protein
MTVVTEVKDWPNARQRASLNSFGYGGANGHAIIESIGSYLRKNLHKTSNGIARNARESDHLFVLPISTMSKQSLPSRMAQISGVAAQSDPETLGRLAYTLAKRRSHLRYRSYLLTQTNESGTPKVVQDQLVEEEAVPDADPLPFGFIFTGQGSQYPGVAKMLLLRSQIFANTIRELDGILRALPPSQAPNWTLEQTILDPDETSQVDESTRSQPLCTAIQIGLVNLLRSWGVNPTAVVGHSSGEIGAAYAAGVHTAYEAILAAYFRGYATSKIQGKGGMISVGLGAEYARDLIQKAGFVGEIHVACVNAPNSTTLSGP